MVACEGPCVRGKGDALCADAEWVPQSQGGRIFYHWYKEFVSMPPLIRGNVVARHAHPLFIVESLQ